MLCITPHQAAAILREELEGCLRLPAIEDAFHSHWAFPIVVDEPQRVLEALRSEGFDAATLGRSTTVAAPPDRPELDPMQARRTLEKLVVLPCYAAMPDAELRRQAAVIRRVVAA
jgi:perosamine synthetase